MTFFYDLNKKLDGILKKPTQLTEGKKPDFLDLDKDGDKKEPMKKAAAEKKVEETQAKPDYIDLDKDGNKKESMKKAARDKETINKKLDEIDMNLIKVLQGGTTWKKTSEPISEAAGSIDFDKVLNAIAALYGDDIYDNDAMQDLANDLEQAGPSDRELDFIIAKGKLPRRLAGIQFSAGDNVQFGEASDDNSPFTAHKRPRVDRPKVGSVERGALHDIEHTATGRRVTRRVDPNTGHSVGSDDDAPASGEKRGRGRPAGKGAGKSIGAKGPSGKSKLMTREEIEEAISALESHGYQVSQLDEKAVSVAQRKAAGIAHAAQKGDIPKSELRGASKEMSKMPKGELTKFAKTKEKGLPKKKEESVEETTVAGSVAVADSGGNNKPAPAKAKTSSGKSGMQFGKGIYEGGLNESLEKRIAEIMNEGLTVNVSQPDSGEPSVTISGTGEDAMKLGELLKLSGMFSSGGYNNVCPGCGGMHEGMGSCQMTETDLANSAANTETMDTDYMVNTLAGGLNGPKTTGQTTIPVINQDPARGSLGPVVESKNDLVELYKRIA